MSASTSNRSRSVNARMIPHDRECDVREGRGVSGAAQAAVLVDNRRQTGGEDPGVCLGDFGAYAGAAGGQRRQSQQH